MAGSISGPEHIFHALLLDSRSSDALINAALNLSQSQTGNNVFSTNKGFVSMEGNLAQAGPPPGRKRTLNLNHGYTGQ